jgi:integrase
MLLQGLRSNEVIALDCDDVSLTESQMRVCGKGKKIRVLPLASDTVLLLDHYLRLERPQHCGPALFVSLKGPARGLRMTPAGMRSLFRHHRRVSHTALAHPHRFRHYAEFRTMPSKLSAVLCFRLFSKIRLGIVWAAPSHGCWSNGNSIRLLL